MIETPLVSPVLVELEAFPKYWQSMPVYAHDPWMFLVLMGTIQFGVDNVDDTTKSP